MKNYSIVHFGIGNVGKTLVDQLFASKEQIKREFGVDLRYCGMFGSRGGFYKKSGFTYTETKKNFANLQTPTITNVLDFLKSLPASGLKNIILVDTTSSDKMIPLVSFVLQKGGYAVLSNKKPLAGTLSEFKKLQKYGGNRLKFETAVGAGLPVMKVIKELLATGDKILEISGCFSGTLGFLCSELENGKSFSKSVALAKSKGFTESDPREDLSGMDVARKAIILARLLGNEIEISDLSVGALFPTSYKKYSIEDFMKQLQELDKTYETMFTEAAKKNMTLRYVATLSSKKVAVGMKEVAKNSPLGNLHGPDNMIVYTTERYRQNPMVIQGPGAGLEVTAAGVFGDILSFVNI